MRIWSLNNGECTVITTLHSLLNLFDIHTIRKNTYVLMPWWCLEATTACCEGFVLRSTLDCWHNSTIKSLIQNSPILFQDNIALSLHCTFQSLMFSDCGENANSISRNDTHTHTRRLPYASGGLRPPRHNYIIKVSIKRFLKRNLYHTVICTP